MTIGALSKRYGRALLELAVEQGLTERVGKELSSFAEMWTTSSDLRELFGNPKVDAAMRKQVVAELAAKGDFSPVAKNALMYLSDRGRLSAIPEIARSFAALAEEKAGTVRAEVTSAAPLPENYYVQLQKALEHTTGRKVSIEKHVDPSLIAGVVTKVGDKVFDGSVRTQLLELKESLHAS